MIKDWPTRRCAPAGFVETPYDIASREDRCAPRTRLTIPATLRPSAAKGFHTVVHDLSLGGFSANSSSRMHIGAVCWLTLPGLEALQAEVIWWEGGGVGCAFAKLLSPIILEHILSRYPAIPDEQPGTRRIKPTSS
jgi:hypothetical protein